VRSRGTVIGMTAEEAPLSAAGEALERHPSLDDRFDPAVRIVAYDRAWPVLAGEELRRLKETLGAVAVRLEHVGSTAVLGLAADEEAVRYAALKRQVVARHPQDRRAYIQGKEEYVAALEGRAVAWTRSRS
jgi:GrpB-like predicted nucleotidyltransferase (UPF0157 family)